MEYLNIDAVYENYMHIIAGDTVEHSEHALRETLRATKLRNSFENR